MIDIPIVTTKEKTSKISNSRREKSKFEEEKIEIFEEKRKSYFKKQPEKRAQSSSNKGKLNGTLPFQSSLEPEFLNLFAKGEEFNF